MAQTIEPEFGSGFSVRQLERARQFYRLYPIASALRTQLNWSQYKLLISIDDDFKREYYELESANTLFETYREYLKNDGVSDDQIVSVELEDCENEWIDATEKSHMNFRKARI